MGICYEVARNFFKHDLRSVLKEIAGHLISMVSRWATYL